MLRLAALFLALLALPGCYFSRSPSRPIGALAFRAEPGVRQPCLVVFLPGFLDGPDEFRSHGWPAEITRSGARCDSVAIDLHVAYYAREAGTLAEVLHEDVLAPAVARGYSEIWLVGASMGGLGATMLARAHPELVDGVVLLSPFLGEESVVNEIEAAGGLREWSPGELPAQMDRGNYSRFLWAWLKGYDDDPDVLPPLYLGWAEGERLEKSARLLAAVLPEGHVASLAGGHGWSTWTPLLRDLVTRARLGRRSP